MPKLLLLPIFQFITKLIILQPQTVLSPVTQPCNHGPANCNHALASVRGYIDRAALTTILHLVKVNKYKNSNIINELSLQLAQ